MQNEEVRGVDSETEGLTISGPGKNFGENVINGIAASPGVALGNVCIHKDIFSHIPILPISDDQIGNEIGRIQKAVEEIEEAIRRDQETIRKKIGPKEAEIFCNNDFCNAKAVVDFSKVNIFRFEV